MRPAFALWLSLLALACATPVEIVTAPPVKSGHRYFVIRAEDEEGTPLQGVSLHTVHHVPFLTDKEGLAAFYEPGLMDQDVFFFAERKGYRAEQDPFGFGGTTLHPVEGGSGTVRLRRAESRPPAVASGPGQRSIIMRAVREGDQCFELQLVDQEDRRGVSLATVVVDDAARYVSDSQGYVALCEPRFLDRRVRFAVRSHGYVTPRMHFNVVARSGAHSVLALKRSDIARRLYRVTGAGIYRDSVLLGKPTPLREPLLNGKVMGQDSVQSVVFGGRAFFVYGDTLRPGHPLGNFHATGATARLPSDDGLSPDLGINLHYFLGQDGFARAMAPPTARRAPRVTWLGGLTVVPDDAGTPTMFAAYAHVNEKLVTEEQGLVRYAPTAERFDKVLRVENGDPMPHGHPTLVHHASGDYLYYQTPIRVPAKAESLLDPSTWETFTPFVERSRLLLRDRDGVLEYAFRKHTSFADESELMAAGVPLRQRLMGHLRDPQTGQPAHAHLESSLAYNPFRKRYVQLVQHVGQGPAPLSEIWYAEGDTPLGPWVYARRIASFEHYTFYNTREHTFLSEEGGRRIYFEGTYTNQFTDAVPTPRYDYNQLMYRLDLTDPRLHLPVPVYEVQDHGSARLVTKAQLPADAGPVAPSFFAHDRPGPGLVKVAKVGADCDGGALAVVKDDSPYPAEFYAYEKPVALSGGRLVPLRLGRRVPGTDGPDDRAEPAGPAEAAMVFVLESGFQVALPVADFAPGPVADGGADLCLRARPDGMAKVSLKAAVSHLADGAEVDYAWQVDEAQFVGKKVTLSLPKGDHPVRLTARTGDDQDEDFLIVHIQ